MTREEIQKAVELTLPCTDECAGDGAHTIYCVKHYVPHLVKISIEQINRALDEAAEQILDPWCHQKIRGLRIEKKES